MRAGERKVLWQAILALLALAVFTSFEEDVRRLYPARRAARVSLAVVAAPATARAPRAVANATRLLFLVEPSIGQYSSSRLGLLEALAVAAESGRALVVRGFTRSCRSPLAQLFALGRLSGESTEASPVTLLDDAMLPDAASLCGAGEALYVVLDPDAAVYHGDVPRPPLGDVVEWKGVRWTVRSAASLLDDAVARTVEGIDADAAAAGGGDATDRLYPPRLLAAHVAGFPAAPAALAARLAALPHTCVAVHALFGTAPWPSTAALGTAVRALRPAAPLDWAVSQWFASHGIAEHEAVAVHLRLSDATEAPTVGCAAAAAASPAWIVDAVAAARARVGGGDPVAAARVPVLLSSNDYNGTCVEHLRAAFPGAVHTVASLAAAGGGGVDGCYEAAFAQEALARSAAFVGSPASAFSAAVAWSRVLRYGAHEDSNSYVDPPPDVLVRAAEARRGGGGGGGRRRKRGKGGAGAGKEPAG